MLRPIVTRSAWGILLVVSAACSGGSGKGGKTSPPPADEPKTQTPPADSVDEGKNAPQSEPSTLDASKRPAGTTPEGKLLTNAVDKMVASPSDDSRTEFKGALFCFIGRQRAANGDAWYDRYNEVMDEALSTPERFAAFQTAEAGLSGTLLGDEDVDGFEAFCTPGLAPTGTLGNQSSGLSGASGSFASNCHTSKPRRTTIVFFNGMLTDVGAAIKHKESLRKAVTAAGLDAELAKGGEGLDYALAYNQNEDYSLQFLQVVGQKGYDIGRTARKTWRRLWNGDKDAEIKNIRESFVTAFDVEKYRHLADEAMQIHGLKSRLGLNHRMVFVSHSQGNFYSNIAYETFDATERKSIRQVMVATPTSSVADGSTRYTTFANDKIMNLVRLATGSAVLPAQNIAGSLFDDFLVHGFSEAYLPNKEAHQRILGHIKDAAAETVYPDTQVVDGRLVATLRWDDPAKDFALHIYEGTRDLDNHVYWDTEAGIYGDLSGKVDDKEWDSYATNCEANPPFQLTFAPQYYSGDGAGHATLSVVYGGAPAMEFPVDVAEATGAVGMLDPPVLVTLKVDVDRGTGQWSVEKVP